MAAPCHRLRPVAPGFPLRCRKDFPPLPAFKVLLGSSPTGSHLRSTLSASVPESRSDPVDFAVA